MEKVTFTTRKPNIIDRIKGYFQRRKYMRRWEREQAERYAVMAELRVERRAL